MAKVIFILGTADGQENINQYVRELAGAEQVIAKVIAATEPSHG